MTALIGMKAICGYVGLSESTIIDLIQKEDFPATKLKGTWISDSQEIDDWRRGIIRNRNKKGDSDGTERGNGKYPSRKAQARKF